MGDAVKRPSLPWLKKCRRVEAVVQGEIQKFSWHQYESSEAEMLAQKVAGRR